MTRQPLRTVCLALIVLLASLQGAQPAEAKLFGKKKQDKPQLVEAGYAPYHGPRTTIAVAKFDAVGAFSARYGGYDQIGGGLAAMLIHELTQTNRFTVVDRADLDAVLKEQEIALKGLATEKTPEAGKLLGARLIVRGTVTRFTENAKGGGLRIGGNIEGITPGVGMRKQKGHVAINIRVIDTTTGQTLVSETVETELTEKSLQLDVKAKGFVVGGDKFKRRPLGKASEDAIRKAVRLVIDATAEREWSGLVSKASGQTVYINAGSNAGLAKGDRLYVTRTLEQITDPETGEVLGSETLDLGTLTIVKAAERYAVATFTGGEGLTPARGDAVRKLKPAED